MQIINLSDIGGYDMRREQISQLRGDCTASYSISGYKATTIGEFVDEVLAECKEEWGYFNSIYEYRYGHLLNEIPEEISKQRISKIYGDGGWTRMDYKFITEEE